MSAATTLLAVVLAAGLGPVQLPGSPLPEPRAVDPLRPFFAETLPGGLAVAATCVNFADPRDGGPDGGTLALQGVPAGAEVRHAWLYWSVLSVTSPVGTGTPTLDSLPLDVVSIGEIDRSPCFPRQPHTGIFRADVTAVVNGDGTYRLEGLPGTGTEEGDLTEGATLLVAWCAAGAAATDIVIYEGVDVTDTEDGRFVQQLGGFVAAPEGPVPALLAVAAGNGQGREPLDEDRDPFVFNGTDLDEEDPTILSGSLCPPGGLYDLTALDVTGLVAPGSTTASLEIRAAGDCHSIGAVALAVATSPDRGVPEPSAVDRDPLVTALRLRRLGDELELSWEDLGLPYDVHRGTIGSWYDHGAFEACGLDVALARVSSEPGDHYFLVIAEGCGGADSSSGRDAFGGERPGAAAASGRPCP